MTTDEVRDETGLESLVDYWDWIGRTSFHIRMRHPSVTDIFYKHIVNSLLSELVSGRPWRILKLDAYNEATNTQYGYNIIGEGQDLILVDISGEICGKALERAVKRSVYGNVHLVVCDFRRLPIRSGCIDLSCSFGSIEHVPEYGWAFYEQVRVVRQGGEVVVGVPNIFNYSIRFFSAKILHAIGLMKKITNPERHFSSGQLLGIAMALGLSDTVLTGYHLFPKQLRWLDLWLEARGRNPLRKSRLFKWLLKSFTYLELASHSVRYFAEMIVIRGVRAPVQESKPSLPSARAGRNQLLSSTSHNEFLSPAPTHSPNKWTQQ